MTTYFAPTQDMQFVIEELADLAGVAEMPPFEEDVSADLVEAVLEEASKLAGEVLAPLNKTGDLQGSKLVDGEVVVPDGFADAYMQYIEGGWNGLSGPVDFDGQGLPELLGTAVHEMWQAANMAFALCPMLTAGACEAIKVHGSDEQKAKYLAKLVTGEWTGTMNLTESQAGSDLSAVSSKAVPEGDHYRIFGQKIFITWGDHSVTENVIHLVLARTPDAPEGVKGISLFIVPKFMVGEEGELGARNDVHCVSLEHKLGIHASPTAVLAFGDNDGAIGYLVGEENKGLAYMFTMMNEARLKVGLQGVAISDRAYQAALSYAKERVQGRSMDNPGAGRVSILHHADVRRMLMCMKSQVEAMRALCYVVAASMDKGHHHPDAATRALHTARVDLLTPVVKGWCTELSVELTSLGVQVHGGMGYVEETGACQYLRDARITPIYEGTTGIQASDLVGRKLTMDKGEAMASLIADMKSTQANCAAALSNQPIIAQTLAQSIVDLEQATETVLAADKQSAMAMAVNYLMLVGYVTGGWLMAKSALVAQQKQADGESSGFYEGKLMTARFYAEQVLPKSGALRAAVQYGSESILTMHEEQF